MTQSRFSSSRIRGIVTVVPPHIRSFDEDMSRLDVDPKQLARIKKNIGLDKRHVADANITTLDLCEAAARKLLDGLGCPLEQIDGLVFVTQTPDHFQPCNAAIVHGEIGLSDHCAAFDVNLGCSGYVYGLWLAHMMTSVGGCRKVLVLAGDTLSKCVNPRDRSVASLFGDAGSATLVEAASESEETFFSLHTDGTGHSHIQVPAGAFRTPASEDTKLETVTEDGNYISPENLQMNGGEVFNFSIKVEPPAIREIVEYASLQIDDVDHVVFHQANKYIISNIVRRLKLPKEKAPSGTVAKYGNQSSASIPATICDALSDKVTGNPQTIIMSGFGVGLSWGACLTKLNLDFCPPIQILDENE